MTPDLYVIAISGGVIQMASPNSAASAFIFVAAMAAAAARWPAAGLVVAALGAAAVGVGAIAYDHSALSVLAYALGFRSRDAGRGEFRQTACGPSRPSCCWRRRSARTRSSSRSARLEESARIARDIHDVLAHTLGRACDPARGHRRVARPRAWTLTRSATRVQRAHALAREGLQETRRAVGALRGNAPDPAPAVIRALIEQYEARSSSR